MKIGPIEAIVFDMDGTLHDSEAIYFAAQHAAAAALGVSISEEFWHSLIGIPAVEGDAMLREHMGPDFPFDEFDRIYREHRDAGLARGMPLKPGVLPLLDHLESRRWRSAVATSASRAAAEAQLTLSGLRPRFEVVVTRDDVTRGKPHPDPFLLAAQRIGVDPARCLAIEDSRHGIRSAHAAGMMAVMVPDLVGPDEATLALCVAVLDDLHGVLELVGK